MFDSVSVECVRVMSHNHFTMADAVLHLVCAGSKGALYSVRVKVLQAFYEQQGSSPDATATLAVTVKFMNSFSIFNSIMSCGVLRLRHLLSILLRVTDPGSKPLSKLKKK